MAKDKTKNRCWGKIRLPKLGWIKARIHRTFNGKIKTATVTLLPSGHYYVSIAVEVDKVNNKTKHQSQSTMQLHLTLGLKVSTWIATVIVSKHRRCLLNMRKN
ncbi:hypothetical protein NA23_10790 [Fervidobacterium islandicum]|uniref:Transposase n=2 Tax=Fervidobacterium islandicum TaxID=2423 RepID=A0AAJ5LCR1_FERIS|nr:hypothetical protein [Fervidobacterium islandicum]UOE96762.1 hypothetical protein NA23_10790 [Fervidobacterium islandicum]